MSDRVSGDRNIAGQSGYSLNEDRDSNLEENSFQVNLRSHLPNEKRISGGVLGENEGASTSSGFNGLEGDSNGKSLPDKSTQPAFVEGNKGLGVDKNSVQVFTESPFVILGMLENVSPNNEMSLLAAKSHIESNGFSGNTVFGYEKRDSLLQIVAALDQPKVLEWLLDKGANVNYINAEGKTALDIARENNHYECMKMLENHGANINDGNAPNINDQKRRSGQMHHATARNPEKPVITQAPSRPASAAPQPQQQFFKAILENDDAKVLSLLKAHSKVIDIAAIDTTTKKSPLRMAIDSRNDTLASLLIEHGAPVNAYDNKGRTPVMLAAAAGMTRTVKSLIERGATLDDMDKSGSTVLHHAASSGDGEIVKLLIGAGVNRNATDKKGCMALHYAAGNGNVDAVKALIDGGAKVDPKDKERKTPLWNACSTGNVEIVRLLLQKGAKAERYCGLFSESTPLIAACTGKSDLNARNIIALLIDRGASANVADKKYGNTPLIAAASNNLMSTATYLLQEGKAVPNAVNKQGQTALYDAAAQRMVSLLASYGVKKGIPEPVKDQN